MEIILEIPIELISDEKGYIDRECPHEECGFVFKVHNEDWKNKNSEDMVFCPRCGYAALSNQWWTQQQIKSMEEIAMSWMMNHIQKSFDESFKKMSRYSNKYFQIKYKPGKKMTFQNNPIGQQEEWEMEVICEKCGTRTSVIGTAFFCHYCGNNAVSRLFNESMDRIKKQLDSLNEMEEMLEKMFDKDTAKNMTQSMIETSLKEIISAYQKFAVECFNKGCTKKARPNDFQIVDKGSELFKKYYRLGYEDWLSSDEITFLSVMFQRRHILEHNNGIVDERYLQYSKDENYKVGQRIVCKKEQVLRLLEINKKLSVGISKAVCMK